MYQKLPFNPKAQICKLSFNMNFSFYSYILSQGTLYLGGKDLIFHFLVSLLF